MLLEKERLLHDKELETINRAISRSYPRNGNLIAQLRANLKGQVIAPADAEYDAARTVFSGDIDRRPAALVRVADATDVANLVGIARQSGLELAIRSGGHSMAGHSVTEGGIVLDLADMRALEVDAAQRTAWAQTGLTSGEYTKASSAYGLATGFGDTGSVGIGGITLGGGIGFLVRKYGLTIDDLLAAEVVTADGQLLRADAVTHPDLFWALRGGGGNFGVVTRMQFRLHPIDKIVGGMLFLPATPDVIVGLIDVAASAPEELSIIANIMSAPPLPFIPAAQHGQIIVMVQMVYAGTGEAGERAVAPLRALATPIADLVKPMRYHEMFPAEENNQRPTVASHTMFVDRIDRAATETIVEYLQRSDAPMRAVQLRVLGGAMSQVPIEATAFAHRHAQIMVNLAAFYRSSSERERRVAWCADLAAALQQGNIGAYVNFLGDEGAERVRAAYPEPTWERLTAIKAHYDPTNFFRLNQNIPPQKSGRAAAQKLAEPMSNGGKR